MKFFSFIQTEDIVCNPPWFKKIPWKVCSSVNPSINRMNIEFFLINQRQNI
jgi:hypothetical protein